MVGFRMNLFKIINAEGIIPNGSGRIAGVAWPRAIVTGEKLLVDAKLFAHLPQAWIGDAHKTSFAHNLTQNESGGVGWECRLLPRLNKKLRVLNGRRRQNPVAKI